MFQCKATFCVKIMKLGMCQSVGQNKCQCCIICTCAAGLFAEVRGQFVAEILHMQKRPLKSDRSILALLVLRNLTDSLIFSVGLLPTLNLVFRVGIEAIEAQQKIQVSLSGYAKPIVHWHI